VTHRAVQCGHSPRQQLGHWNLRGAESGADAVEHLLKNPAADSENGADAVEFDFVLALTDLKADVEEESEAVNVEKDFGEVLGQLVVAFELISDRVQERTGRSHVTDRPPRASPATQFVWIL